jgi:hypothetical protein
MYPGSGPPPQFEAPNSLSLTGSPNISIATSGSNLVVSFTGVLGLADGGTANGALTPTAGGIAYFDGTKMESTAAAPFPQMVLSSPNTGTTPYWRTIQDSYTYAAYGGL